MRTRRKEAPAPAPRVKREAWATPIRSRTTSFASQFGIIGLIDQTGASDEDRANRPAMRPAARDTTREIPPAASAAPAAAPATPASNCGSAGRQRLGW